MHWAHEVLNKPWVLGARGPNSFDCWGLVYYIYKRYLGIELPSYLGVDSRLAIARKITENSKTWIEVPRHEWKEFQIVAMTRNDKYYHHVGLYTKADGGLIIHASEFNKVKAEKPAFLLNNSWSKLQGFKQDD